MSERTIETPKTERIGPKDTLMEKLRRESLIGEHLPVSGVMEKYVAAIAGADKTAATLLRTWNELEIDDKLYDQFNRLGDSTRKNVMKIYFKRAIDALAPVLAAEAFKLKYEKRSQPDTPTLDEYSI